MGTGIREHAIFFRNYRLVNDTPNFNKLMRHCNVVIDMWSEQQDHSSEIVTADKTLIMFYLGEQIP